MLVTFATARRYGILFATASGLMFAIGAAPAAEQQTLRFKLVVQPVGEPTALPEIGGHTLTAAKYAGVAVFEDGRIAYKRFVEVDDDEANSGAFKGYSTYTFENGDSLTLSYTGGWDGQGMTGDYQLISGTGQYAGATGTGSFKGVDDQWEGANLLEGSFTITLATQ